MQYKLPNTFSKKSLSISRSSENINLPEIRSKYSRQNLSNKSNGGTKYSIDSRVNSRVNSRQYPKYGRNSDIRKNAVKRFSRL